MQPQPQVDFIRDFSWQDGFMPEIGRILAMNAPHLMTIKVASYQQDVKQATDMVMSISGMKSVAVRLRRASYAYRDLTIRAVRSSGAKTELEKIKAGNGDFYLYGWTHDFQISEWMLVDLARLRSSGLLNQPHNLITNADWRTGFIAISYRMLRLYGCVINSNVRAV